MGIASDAYQRMLMALLPPGRLWRLIGGSTLSNLFLGCADEIARLDGRVNDLLAEAYPPTANELLADYEAELGLVAASTAAERQANIVARLVARQGFRPIDFQNALAPLLAQAAADVVVLERTHAFAASIGDDREVFRFFIYRDPTLAGTYFLDSAQVLVDTIKPSHTVGQVIESVNFLCDDAHSLCDRDLLGAVLALAPSIGSVSPAGSVSLSSTETWNVSIAVEGEAQTSVSARLTVHYPTGGRPATAPSITSTPSGWTAGSWDNSVADYWTCTVTAASLTTGTSTFSLSSGSGSAVGTLVLGVDTVQSTETAAAGIAATSSSSNVTVVPSWTVDATSGIATPVNATEWASFLSYHSLSIAVPDALWLFQEASGNPADAIGGFPLTASGTGLGYLQTVSGWSRKAITLTEGNNSSLSSTSASLPDLSMASQFTVIFAKVTAPTATRRIINQGTTTKAELRALTGPKMEGRSGSNVADGTADPTGSVKPFGLRSNHTALTTTAFSDTEKLVPTHASVTGKAVVFGANSDSNAPTMSLPYGFEWHGANAEISDADYKALLQAMGFTITWT